MPTPLTRQPVLMTDDDRLCTSTSPAAPHENQPGATKQHRPWQMVPVATLRNHQKPVTTADNRRQPRRPRDSEQSAPHGGMEQRQGSAPTTADKRKPAEPPTWVARLEQF